MCRESGEVLKVEGRSGTTEVLVAGFYIGRSYLGDILTLFMCYTLLPPFNSSLKFLLGMFFFFFFFFC